MMENHIKVSNVAPLHCENYSQDVKPPQPYKFHTTTATNNRHINGDRQYKYNPKPLGKKNSRSFVPEEKKTEEYWQKRIKNNVAARKSREDRRRKELETLSKKAQYEKENVQLRMFVDKMQSENQYLLYEITMLREEKGCPKL